jgi:hypothetical protein
MEERGSSDEGRPTGITLPDNFASIELEKLIKERESGKKKGKK